MRKPVLLLFAGLFAVLAYGQDRKPCGTAVLAKRHHKTQSVKTRQAAQEEIRHYEGEKKGLIILVEFPDVSFKSEDPLQTWSDIANQEGYADNGAPGSVSDYFYNQSYGQFQLKFDVVGPFEAQHEYAYYGQNKDWGTPTGWFDQNVGELVEEACLAASPQVRFADYDWNEDGEVDQVFLLYAGHGENDYWYKDSTVIWPHAATLSFDWEGYENGLLLQGVRINTYACSNEINRSNHLAGMGAFCHEFSHCLGLPDLYDTKRGTSIVGTYDLMDQGCYNNNSWCPVGYSSYERYACGWLTPDEIDDPLSVVAGTNPDDELTRVSLLHFLRPLTAYPDVCIYRESPDANDYLIENRQKESWDTYIPRAGLLAWHIDYNEQAWYENTVNIDPDYLRVRHMSPDEITPTDIIGILRNDSSGPCSVYDVHGHRLTAPPTALGIYILRFPDGTTKKVLR